MKSLGFVVGLVGMAAFLVPATAATAGPVAQAQVSAKSKYAKCKAKKTSKARKHCRKQVTRQAKLKRQAKQTWWVDYAGTASQRPRTFALGDYAPGSGPVVSKLKWKNWGYPRTVATGVLTSPAVFPGAPPQTADATITATSPVRCKAKFGTKKGKRIYVYRKVRFKALNTGFGGDIDLDITQMAGYQVCKEPATD